jgi:dipeptide/tripeptide permease
VWSLALAAATLGAALGLLVAVQWRIKRADHAVVPEDMARGMAPCRTACMETRFYKYMAATTLLIPVRMVFRHLDATLPVYMIRASPEGEEAHFALIQAINPALIVLFIVVTPVLPLRAFSLKDKFLIGTSIAAMGPLVLGWLLPLTGIGWLTLDIIAFVVLFSIGEAIFSPRVEHFGLKVAPKGTEAVYAALAVMPSLLPKLPTSYMSAWLMDSFCPKEGASCNGAVLWSIIGLTAALTPLGLTLFQRWLVTPDEGTETE